MSYLGLYVKPARARSQNWYHHVRF